MESGVYVITCTGNGTSYVGSSVDLQKRWREHQRKLERGGHENPILQRAWSKYGPGAFRFDILERARPEHLLAVEQSFLDFYFRRPGCVNIAVIAGAPMRGRRHSENARQAMRHPKSDATRRRMSATRKRLLVSGDLPATRVVATDIETGERHIFASLCEAARVGHDQASISKCLNGARRTHHGFRRERAA
jgi:group I intron endonuclease